MSEYYGRLELEKGDLKKISNSELKSKIMRWDTERWKSEKESKTILAVYSRFKKEISEKEIYVNDYNSVLLYRCRSNTYTLKLGWRSRFVGGLVEVETVEHFLLECGGLAEMRRVTGMEGVPICELLLFGVRREVRDKHRGYIGRLLRKREEVLKLHEEHKT